MGEWVLDELIAHASAHPDRTAASQDGVPIGYATFVRAIGEMRRAFARAALPPKGVAIVRAGLLVESWCALIALRSLGLDTIVVPDLKVVAELNLKGVVCVVGRHKHLADDETGVPAIAEQKRVLVPEDLWNVAAAGPLPRPDGASKVGGHIVHTSGTTGTSKKILMDSGTDAHRVARMASLHGWPKQPMLYSGTLGPWGSVGYKYPLLVWHEGGCVVFDQGPEPWGRFFEHKLTAAFLNPVQLRDLPRVAARSNRAPGNVEIRVLGAVIGFALVETLQRHVSSTIRTQFGSSECSGIMGSLLRTPDDIQWYAPFPDRTVEIIDEAGRLCGDGEEGELRVRLLVSDARSYLDDPETTARFFRDGYFHPGDSAVRRADGRIRVLGRLADVLNIGGAEVALAPVEQRIRELLGAENVCVFSHLNDAGTNQLAIAYESASPAERDALQQLARQFPQFGQVRFMRFAEFPRTGSLQKVDRRELRRQVFEGKSR